MWIKINGVDKIKEVNNYYFDNVGNKVCIYFSGNSKKYSYKRENVDIGPTTLYKLKNNEIILYEEKPLLNTEYCTFIGDYDIDINGIMYKKRKICFQEFRIRSVNDNYILKVEGKIIEFICLEESKDYFRITYTNGKKYVIHKNKIQLVKKYNNDYSNLLLYYKEIANAKDKDFEGEVEHYLENQIDKINLTEDLSLYNYLKQETKMFEDKEQLIYPFGINLSQREAIDNAMKNQFSLIQGPPGTGKTQSILNIIANLIVRNKSIAVVSGNNEAIKNVVEKMEKNNYGFLMALLGKSENKKYFFGNQKEYPKEMSDWKRSEEELEYIIKEVQFLEKKMLSLLEKTNKLSIALKELIEYEHEYTFFKEYIKSEEILELKRFKYRSLNNQQLLVLAQELESFKINDYNLIKKISYVFKYGVIDFKQFKKFDSIVLWLKAQYYEEKIKRLKIDIENYQTFLSDNNFDSTLILLTDKSQEYFNAILANRYSSSFDSRKKFQIDTYFHDSEFSEFVKEYPVVLSTTHAIAKSKSRSYIFDFLIVDEASQVELVPGIIALSTARNAIIVGDLKQLPHIPSEKIGEEQYELLHSIYCVNEEYNYKIQSLLSSFDCIFSEKVPNVLLKEHYRCHEKIISFCNKKYYNGQLICHTKIQVKKPLILLKTVSGNHLRFGKNAKNKITNLRELDSIADKKFLEELNIEFDDNETLGFMAPFRGQVNASKEVLPSEFQKDTVHKFQGRECDTIILSSVLDSKRISQYLMQFVDEPHLINVAVSRAIKRFVLVSDVDSFRKTKGEINDLIRHIEYYKEDSELFQSDIRSVFDLLYTDYQIVYEQKRKTSGKALSKFQSENLIMWLLDEIFQEEGYDRYKYAREIKLKEIFRNIIFFTEEEQDYIINNAKVDFLVYNKFDNQPLFAIEVDGFAFHENSPVQLERDRKKDEIFKKGNIKILRLKTNSSQEKEKIKKMLNTQIE